LGTFSSYLKVYPALEVKSRYALSVAGTEKLYIGESTTIISASCNSEISPFE